MLQEEEEDAGAGLLGGRGRCGPRPEEPQQAATTSGTLKAIVNPVQ